MRFTKMRHPEIFDHIEDLSKIKEYVKGGGNIDYQCANGRTLLMFSSARRNLRIVVYLIRKGAKLNLQDGYGDTALFDAGRSGDERVVRVLIAKGAKLNIQNNLMYYPSYCSLLRGGVCGGDARMKIYRYMKGLKGPLRLTYIVLNLIEEKDIPHEGLPEILFAR